MFFFWTGSELNCEIALKKNSRSHLFFISSSLVGFDLRSIVKYFGLSPMTDCQFWTQSDRDIEKLAARSGIKLQRPVWSVKIQGNLYVRH